MTFFKTARDMLLQCCVQRLFSVDEHIVLLEENTARNPEFDHDHLEFANIDNSECKVNFILPELADGLHHPERVVKVV